MLESTISEGIDINKTISSKECDICCYWHFLDKGFKFEPDVWNGCYDILMMSVNLINIAILNIWNVDYRCIINGISKSQAVNLLQKLDLKVNHYKT